MLRRRYFAVALICILSSFVGSDAALARDRSFAAVLKGLKQDYHLKQQSVPGLWLAKCVIKFLPTPGMSKIDFVLFDEEGLRELASAHNLDTRIQGMLGSDWSPFVQVDSSADKERVLIFARPSGRRMDLFILTCEPGEGVAMFLRVSPKVMKDMLDDPASPPSPVRTRT